MQNHALIIIRHAVTSVTKIILPLLSKNDQLTTYYHILLYEFHIMNPSSSAFLLAKRMAVIGLTLHKSSRSFPSLLSSIPF